MRRYRQGLPARPKRMRHLPLDDRGYPVPYFVPSVDGRPAFQHGSLAALSECVRRRLCWVCGRGLGASCTFVTGPMAVINHVHAEPPCHGSCARYSATACPFLRLPQSQRKDAKAQTLEWAGIMHGANPGLVALVSTRQFHTQVATPGGAPLFHIGEIDRVHWIAQGKPATVEQVEEGIARSSRRLAETAESPEDLTEIIWLTVAAMGWLPEEKG